MAKRSKFSIGFKELGTRTFYSVLHLLSEPVFSYGVVMHTKYKVYAFAIL
jgi:hypothetical protein